MRTGTKKPCYEEEPDLKWGRHRSQSRFSPDLNLPQESLRNPPPKSPPESRTAPTRAAGGKLRPRPPPPSPDERSRRGFESDRLNEWSVSARSQAGFLAGLGQWVTGRPGLASAPHRAAPVARPLAPPRPWPGSSAASLAPCSPRGRPGLRVQPRRPQSSLPASPGRESSSLTPPSSPHCR